MFVLALLQAAVDENFFAVDLQAVTAAGDRVGGAEKCQFHGMASFVYNVGACLYCTPSQGKKLHQFVNNV